MPNIIPPTTPYPNEAELTPVYCGPQVGSICYGLIKDRWDSATLTVPAAYNEGGIAGPRTFSRQQLTIDERTCKVGFKVTQRGPVTYPGTGRPVGDEFVGTEELIITEWLYRVQFSI